MMKLKLKVFFFKDVKGWWCFLGVFLGVCILQVG